MSTKTISEPDNTNELLRGWLLHAHKGRDLGARAERHRIAGVKYKAVIRQMEQLGIGEISGIRLDAEIITEIRQKLDALEEEMPVVSSSIYERIETRFQDRALESAPRRSVLGQIIPGVFQGRLRPVISWGERPSRAAPALAGPRKCGYS